MSQSNLANRTPTPSNMQPVARDTFEFLMRLMATSRVTYKSPHEEFIRNSVLEEQRKIIEACLYPADL